MTSLLLDWPYAALALALVLLVWIAREPRPAHAGPRWRDPASVLPLLWPMYLVHQFEEHGIDLLGQRYAFLGDLCTSLGHPQDLAHCPADPAFVFAVNVVGCQLAFAMSLVFRRRAPLIAACAWGIPLINAVAHIASSLRFPGYNAGLATSVLLFVPLCAWMLHTCLRAGVLRPRHIPRIVATGVLSHATLLASLLLFDRGLLSHAALLALNALNGLLPLALGYTRTRP